MKSDVESGLPRMVAANSCQLLLEVGKLIAISVLWLGVSRVKTTLQICIISAYEMIQIPNICLIILSDLLLRPMVVSSLNSGVVPFG